MSCTSLATEDAAILTGQGWVFWLYSSIYLLLFCTCIYLALRMPNYIGFLLSPLVLAALIFENIALGVLIEQDPSSLSGLIQTRVAITSFIVPLFLVTMFEVNYEVHKQRSANFFGCITFDQGRRLKFSFASNLVRYSTWLFAFALTIVSIIGSAEYIVFPLHYTKATRFVSGVFVVPDDDQDGIVTLSEITDFLVPLIFTCFSMYTGLSFWRYGTTISTDVRASVCNPWAGLFLVSTAHLVAAILTPSDIMPPYATGATQLAVAVAFVWTLHLVRVNVLTLRTMESEFLSTLEVRNSTPKTAADQRQARQMVGPAAPLSGSALEKPALGYSIRSGSSSGSTRWHVTGPEQRARIRAAHGPGPAARDHPTVHTPAGSARSGGLTFRPSGEQPAHPLPRHTSSESSRMYDARGSAGSHRSGASSQRHSAQHLAGSHPAEPQWQPPAPKHAAVAPPAPPLHADDIEIGSSSSDDR